MNHEAERRHADATASGCMQPARFKLRQLMVEQTLQYRQLFIIEDIFR